MDDTNSSSPIPEDIDADADISELIVKALNEAARKTRESGLPYITVVDGGLYMFDGKGGKELLKMMPPRIVVTQRTKRINPQD